MNLSQIRAGGWRVFARQSAEKRNQNIQSAQYIETLAQQTGTQVGLWNIFELFGVGRGNNLLQDRSLINQRFFQKKSEQDAVTTNDATRVRELIRGPLERIANEQRSNRIRQLTREHERYKSRVISFLQQAAQFNADAYRCYLEINRWNGAEAPILDEIMAILRDTFWEFHDFDGRCISFLTRTDVVLTEINPAAGLNIRLNMGKFRAALPLDNPGDLRVFPHSGNTLVNRYPHPHVGQDGWLCWGNASAQSANFAAAGQLSQLMRLLSSLLTSYSAEAPFVSLVRFQEAQGVSNGSQAQEETQAAEEDMPF